MPLDLTQSRGWGNQLLRCVSDRTIGLRLLKEDDLTIRGTAEKMTEEGLFVVALMLQNEPAPKVQHLLGLVGLKGIPKKECLSTLERMLNSSRFEFEAHILGERGMSNAFLQNLLGNNNKIIEKVALQPYLEKGFNSSSTPPAWNRRARLYDINIEKERLCLGRFRDAYYHLRLDSVTFPCFVNAYIAYNFSQLSIGFYDDSLGAAGIHIFSFCDTILIWYT